MVIKDKHRRITTNEPPLHTHTHTMNISSKSILSPGRAPNSLSNSLSRRLRNSGSIKGLASPAMFSTTAKKRGSFENPEPSSPKVTCIGQVRVKSKKKQAKKLRRDSACEVSFRKVPHPLNGTCSKTQNNNVCFDIASTATQNPNQECSPVQRSWVHFPVTICDALRAFGSEFSCLFPCRKEDKMEERSRQGSCGAVFARWLVAVQDGDGGTGKDIELVVGEEEESVFKKPRRHVFEDLDIINDTIEGQKDGSRVSICIPPKNALLLMRCRSDPMKMEALSNRSWEPNLDNSLEEEELVDQIKEETIGLKEPQGNLENEAQNQENDNVDDNEANQDQEHQNVQQDEADQDKEQETVQEDEANQYIEQENAQQDEVGQDQDKELSNEEEEESLYLGTLFDEIVNQDSEIDEDKAVESGAEELTTVTEFAEISESHEEEMVDNGILERECEVKEERENKKVLPECLLMMMYEPKLSMEVSKETWVCSSDFIKPHSSRRKPPPPLPPARAVVKTDGGDQSVVIVPANANFDDLMRVANGGYQPELQQPARSSCSYPVAPSMTTVIEQKLADAVGYEPFVLTRCKSEPMKTAAAKLLPESCVWENRKMERLSRVEFSVGAAGLGF